MRVVVWVKEERLSGADISFFSRWHALTHWLQLSLAALMSDHVMGVYENKQFDIPLKIGGCANAPISCSGRV